MSRLPVDPQLARILVEPGLTAVNEMLIICSLMSVREVRERPHDKQQKADQLHQTYHKNDSDVLTAISLWKQLEENKQGLSSNGFKQWCSKNLINFLGWLEWRKVYYQLKESVESIGIIVNQSEAHDDAIHSALIPGFITHIFCKTQEKHYQGVRNLKVWLHPSSLSFKKNKPWLLSAEMIETEKLYARMNCPIQPVWLEKTAQHLLKSNYLDIHWRKKNGQVMAYLNQSLLGLPVVNQKLVNYISVDQDKCRQLFLKQGLASDQINDDYPFLRANRDKLTHLAELEQRQRLNNICIDNESLAELYQSVLPSHICSAASLKKWLKKDFKTRNKLLSFSNEQLTQNETNENEAYPSQISVKGFNLDLSYCFAPGSEEDGVSVEIPENMLAQFNDRDFDWLVPGYLEDKVLATLKSLPKVIRRELIPLNETAQKCSQELSKADQERATFIVELARVLQKLTGKQIKQEFFDMTSISSHLTMKYKVLGNKSNTTVTSLAFNGLKKQLLKDNVEPSNVGDKYINWQFEVFSIEKNINKNSQVSRIFQGLKDCEKHVVIEHFPSRKSALASHVQGVARLVLLNNTSQLNQFFNSWPERKQLEKLSIRFNGFRSVFDSIVIKWVIDLIVSEMSSKNEMISIISSEEDFKALNQKFNIRFRENIASQLSSLLPLVQQREKIFSSIAELKISSFENSINDMREQLKLLWSSKVLISSGVNVFQDYSRFHSGLIMRIKRIQLNYPKEQSAMETWVEWLDWWDEISLNNQTVDIKPSLDHLFWLLQEYRISLFSPGTKVKGSVSSKKLQKQFELIESQMVN